MLVGLGLLFGFMPAYVFGDFMPVCGSAWFRNLGGSICNNALLVPTIFSFVFAVPGMVMLIAGIAMRQKND